MAGSEHNCTDVDNFPLDSFFQHGTGIGAKILIVGESLAKDGWQKTGKAFHGPSGTLLPSGRELNQLLSPFNISLEMCGYTDIIKCHVKSKIDLAECGRKWWPVFEKKLASTDTKLIISLGVTTLEIINENAPGDHKIGALTQLNVGNKTYYFLPMYHPSPINPNNRENNRYIFNKVMFDLKKIINSF